jgi:hypothetical protein
MSEPIPTKPANNAEIRPEDGSQDDEVFPLEEYDEGQWS